MANINQKEKGNVIDQIRNDQKENRKTLQRFQILGIVAVAAVVIVGVSIFKF